VLSIGLNLLSQTSNGDSPLWIKDSEQDGDQTNNKNKPFIMMSISTQFTISVFTDDALVGWDKADLNMT
jgi:hypothetical protein